MVHSVLPPAPSTISLSLLHTWRRQNSNLQSWVAEKHTTDQSQVGEVGETDASQNHRQKLRRKRHELSLPSPSPQAGLESGVTELRAPRHDVGYLSISTAASCGDRGAQLGQRERVVRSVEVYTSAGPPVRRVSSSRKKREEALSPKAGNRCTQPPRQTFESRACAVGIRQFDL